METSGQGFGIANFVILHYYSRDYLKMYSNSFSFLGLHEWDSVPNRSDDGSISCLVCVCFFPGCSLHYASGQLQYGPVIAGKISHFYPFLWWVVMVVWVREGSS